MMRNLQRPALHGLVWLLLAAAAAGVLEAMSALPTGPGLAPAVDERLALSGVSNPVTAVLLNFRGYDTLLEIAVLTVALVAVWSLGPMPANTMPTAGPVLSIFTRLLAPLLVLTAGYLLWAGSSQPGGAFQAGAVLAAAGVLMFLVGFPRPHGLTSAVLRLAVVIGLLVFLAVALGVMVLGGRALEYPPTWSGELIVLVEAVATVSIAAILAILLAGGRPEERP